MLLCAFLVLLPCLVISFFSFDDREFFLDNSAVPGLSPAHLRMMFTIPAQKIYAPLPLVSFAGEYALFGPGPVESVAWVTERKNVFYTFLYLASILTCLKSQGEPGRARLFLALSLACAFLSALAKPMVLSLPLVLFLLDWFLRRRLSARRRPRALKLRPTTLPGAYNNRGLVYYKMGKVDEALSDYQKALHLKPDNTEAYNNLGNLYFSQARQVFRKEALENCDRAIAMKKEFAVACSNRGTMDIPSGIISGLYRIAKRPEFWIPPGRGLF